MPSAKTAKLINEQINKEIFSAYLYYGIASYYQGQALDGFAKWFKKQAEEELEHADKFLNYLHENSIEVKLEAIARPECSFKGLREPLELQLSHEKAVTASIAHIYDVAEEEKDRFTMAFLDWFISEQYEEETTARELLDTFDHMAVDSKGVYQLSEKLGERK